MIFDANDEATLRHYGILRRSGRYPWGSGGEPHQDSRSFLGAVKELRDKGMTDKEIAVSLGMNSTQFRESTTIARAEKKQADISQAQRLQSRGLSNVAIGEKMGINESSVRALLAPGQREKAAVVRNTADMLKSQVADKTYVDIGVGVEHHIGVSATKIAAAVAVLKAQGYEVHKVQVDQLGTSNKTIVKVLTPPGTTYGEVASNKDKIRQIAEYSNDGGRTFLGIHPPISISSRRVAVRYKEDGGAAADGVIYVRPGVKDVTLDGARYAQVRIAVNGTHYLKGMAMYKDDLPPGVDLMFNTNKNNTGNKLDAMKPLKTDKDGNIDKDNPFGSVIDRQIGKHQPDGSMKLTSVMNLVNEEGSWDKWSSTLSSQFLSKQSPALAKAQLNVTYERKKAELDEIMSFTNPTVRKKLLETFADSADASAVHLKAAGFKRQGTKVILPIESIKETEIYAPTFRNGEKVVLIRHPHGGIFEIPELTVNNKNPEARKNLGQAPDAVGIHHKVANKLSGADFDGDTVLVIPNRDRQVKTAPTLEGLKKFDPISAYPKYEGMHVMTADQKGFAMGDVSNLITDMTIKGAPLEEVARAVRHSMVVIDAEKHHLNYKQSAIDNGIAQLKAKYQGSANAGAATLISRATSRTDVPERKQSTRIDPVTGQKIFIETGATKTTRSGKVVPKTQPSQKLAETHDARTLVSAHGGMPIEKIYADHSNKLKALANEARRAVVATKNHPSSPSAKTAYSNEVASLNAKLNIALRNAPLERQAQIVGNSVVSQKRRDNPDMDQAEIKKLKSQALKAARDRTGAGKERIIITDKEWTAIQAGAISNEKLNKILDNADLDRVKELATPRTQHLMTSAKKQLAQAKLAAGYTLSEVADDLGVSVTTLKASL